MNWFAHGVCIFVGIMIANFISDITFRKEDNDLLKNAKEIMVECQKSLPRNEFCELKAVPKQKSVEEK